MKNKDKQMDQIVGLITKEFRYLERILIPYLMKLTDSTKEETINQLITFLENVKKHDE